MFIVITTFDAIVNTDINMTRADLIEMIEDGCFIKEPIARIIELSSGLLGRDITADIAKEIWDGLNADDRAPHHELEQWLKDFGHDCTDFGFVPEPRSMHVPPYRG
jgi:hypothetical protein